MIKYAMVFITAPNKNEAEKISRVLLDKRLIACANIIENVKSAFWWHDKLESAEEVLLIAKTSASLIKKLIKAVKAVHSYDIPEIIAFPVADGYKPYLKWISEVVT